MTYKELAKLLYKAISKSIETDTYVTRVGDNEDDFSVVILDGEFNLENAAITILEKLEENEKT